MIVSRANKPTVGTVTLGDVTVIVSLSVCGSFDWLSSLWSSGHSYRFAGEAGYSTGNMAYTGPMLSPPWYTLQKKFKNTFGCDPAVTVKDLDTSTSPIMVVPIIVNDQKKGTALRTLIPATFPMGNGHSQHWGEEQQGRKLAGVDH